MTLSQNERPLVWIASSYKDLMALPRAVRNYFGFALWLAQAGDQADTAKVLKGLYNPSGLHLQDAHATRHLARPDRGIYSSYWEKSRS